MQIRHSELGSGELDRILREYRLGTLAWELPRDVEMYPREEERRVMQHVESMSEIIDAASHYGIQLQRVDGQTVDIILAG